MGKKISIDSATMMNKVFEIIEAKKIFNLKYNQLEILIHPQSYLHAIVKFNNGLTKLPKLPESLEHLNCCVMKNIIKIYQKKN